jgi:hypothetical protein
VIATSNTVVGVAVARIARAAKAAGSPVALATTTGRRRKAGTRRAPTAAVEAATRRARNAGPTVGDAVKDNRRVKDNRGVKANRGVKDNRGVKASRALNGSLGAKGNAVKAAAPARSATTIARRVRRVPRRSRSRTPTTCSRASSHIRFPNREPSRPRRATAKAAAAVAAAGAGAESAVNAASVPSAHRARTRPPMPHRNRRCSMRPHP